MSKEYGHGMLAEKLKNFIQNRDSDNTESEKADKCQRNNAVVQLPGNGAVIFKHYDISHSDKPAKEHKAYNIRNNLVFRQSCFNFIK
mgnify:CR=1 FL=1